MKTKIIIIFQIVFICFNLYGQSDFFMNKTRKVSVETKDGEYSFEIQTEKKTRKSKTDLVYYWYDKGIINYTKGAYTGYLLHGEYLYFKKNTKDILVKGFFKNGLKSGTWMNWTEDGSLTTLDSWKKGRKNGESISYDENNQIVTSYYYKNGKQHGWQSDYKKGELLTRQKYKKGKPYDGGFLGIKNLKLFDKEKKEKKKNKKSKDADIVDPDEVPENNANVPVNEDSKK